MGVAVFGGIVVKSNKLSAKNSHKNEVSQIFLSENQFLNPHIYKEVEIFGLLIFDIKEEFFSTLWVNLS